MDRELFKAQIGRALLRAFAPDDEGERWVAGATDDEVRVAGQRFVLEAAAAAGETLAPLARVAGRLTWRAVEAYREAAAGRPTHLAQDGD